VSGIKGLSGNPLPYLNLLINNTNGIVLPCADVHYSVSDYRTACWRNCNDPTV